MRPRIEAERLQDHIAAALYTNGRTMPDLERPRYQRQLQEAVDGKRTKPARPSPEQLRALGMSIRIEDETGKEMTST